jgi:predicted alpha/beta hydrolase
MQANSDIFLGWDRVDGFDGVTRDFYVRQLRDWKGAAVVEGMTPTTLAMYGVICARALARAHARSGDRIAIASYLGGSAVFDRAIAEFSEVYADQNERDFDALVRAEAGGRITAQHGL